MKKLKSQVFFWMMIIITPLFLALATYNVYILHMLDKQAAMYNKDTLLIFSRPVQNNINYMTFAVSNALANNSVMKRMNRARSYGEAFVYSEDIVKFYRGMLDSKLEGLAALAISAPENGMTRVAYADDPRIYRYEDEVEIEKAIEQQISIPDSHKIGWQMVRCGEKNYLIRILRHDKLYAAAVLDLSLIYVPQDEHDKEISGYMLYTDAEYNPLTMQEDVYANGITLKEIDGAYQIVRGTGGRKFMLVESDFPYAGLHQFYVSPYKGAFQYLDYMQGILLSITFLIAAMIPISLVYMKKRLFNPLESLTETMQRIGDGDVDARMSEKYNITEFIRMQDSFNAMVEKIRQLKIHAYERELQLKNIQMRYLQIQIRPHFFLNCLKNVQALAVQKDYRRIEELIIVLSKYLRSMMQNNPMFVALKEELAGAENYIALQKMCQANPPECQIDAAPEVMELPVPPLSIITFLENSIKHAGCPGKTLVLSVKASRLSDGKNVFLCITIQDNGPGFSEDILKRLGNETVDGGKGAHGEHIGIQNVRERFALLYHGKADILFSNSNGACVEMYLPIENTDEGV